MTFGELKVEVLKSIGITSEILTADRIDEYEADPDMYPYLQQFEMAYKRCVADLRRRHAQVKGLNETAAYDGPIYDVTEFIAAWKPNGIPVTVKRIGQSVFLDLKEGQKYYVEVCDIPFEVKRNSDETGLRSELEAIVPYFIKSELLRMEEPDEAANCRNIYEAELEQWLQVMNPQQTEVEDVYSGI